ncbi:MAG: ribosome maturation factor RimM [Clostridiales bacterium]|jgi:16S rRNA processing protein RimM|nr:ribosome maturation factor RimM [Clostridiales bacterium]
MDSYFTIGKIVNTQGLKGDVRVIPFTDEPKRFERLSAAEVFFERAGSSGQLSGSSYTRTYFLEKVWYHKKFVILKFQGVDDISAAEALKNGVIKIPPEQALPLGKDEYYLRDIYDMTVTAADGKELGIVTDILQTGAHDVYTVRNADGREILIPAVKQFVLRVDVAAKRMTVDLPEGL